MADIGYYVNLAIALFATVGVIAQLAPPSFEEWVRRGARVVCFFALAIPIVSALGSLSEIKLPDFDAQSTVTGGYADVSREAFSEGVRLAISDRLGTEESSVQVEIEEFSLESMRALDMTVTLYGAAALFDTRALREWLEESFLSEDGICKVVIMLD